MITTYDLGSNSLRVLLYDEQQKTICYKKSFVVGTSVGMCKDKKIQPKAVATIIKTLLEIPQLIPQELQKDSSQDGSQNVYWGHIYGVATAAFRIAINADEVIDEIAQKTGITFCVIDAYRESYLTTLAVHYRLKKLYHNKKNLPFVLCDIGGASTEIIFCADGEMVSESFDIGVVILSEEYCTEKGDYIDWQKTSSFDAIFDQMRDFIQTQLKNHRQPLTFTATAGTPTILASVLKNIPHKDYDPSFVNGTCLKLDDISLIKEQLLHLSHQELDDFVGRGRGNFIFVGTFIFEQIYHFLGYDECIVIDDGLSAGIALDKDNYALVDTNEPRTTTNRGTQQLPQ